MAGKNIIAIIVLNVLIQWMSIQGQMMRDNKELEIHPKMKHEFLRLKYKFVRALGQGPCWICHNIHSGQTGIPLVGIPLDLSMILNMGRPMVMHNHTWSETKQNEPAIEIIGWNNRPEWCFMVNNSTKGGQRACAKTNLQIKGKNDKRTGPLSVIMRGENETMKKFKDALNMQYCPNCVVCNCSSNPPKDIRDRSVCNETYLHRKAWHAKGTCKSCLLNKTKQCQVRQWFADLMIPVSSYGNNHIERSLVLEDGLYFCQDLECRPYIPVNATGWFYLALVVPMLHPHNHTSSQYAYNGPPPGRIRLAKRSKLFLFTDADLVWGWFPNMYGATVSMMTKLNNFSLILDRVLNETDEEIHLLNLETKQLRKVIAVVQMRIEMIEHVVSGLCELTEGGDCCTWVNNITEEVPDYYDLIEKHRFKIHDLQDEYRHIAEDAWNPFKSLGGIGEWFGGIFTWFRKVGHLLLMIGVLLLGGLIVWKIGCCVLSRCSRSEKTIRLLQKQYTVMVKWKSYGKENQSDVIKYKTKEEMVANFEDISFDD